MTRILISLILLALTACQRTDVVAANASATDFAKHVPGATSAVCADVDADGDGYVSCTVFRGNDEPMQIQCGSERICIWNCARGCKYEPTMKLNGRRPSPVRD